MNILQLRQMLADARKAAQAIHNAPGGINGSLTDQQRIDYDAHMASAKQLQGDVARAEQMLDLERTAPAANGQATGIEVVGDNATKKPWASLGEQLLAVKVAATTKGRVVDQRLHAAIGQNETIDSEGGFMVQPDFSSELLTRAFDSGLVTSRCRTTPMSSSRLVLNGIDDSSRLNGARFGGIAVYRIAEAALYTASKLRFRRVELNATKLIGMFFATDELLEDAAALEKQIGDYFPEAFAWQLDYEVLNGTGAGQFLGISVSGAAVVTPKTAGQAAATFTTQNALDMRSRLWVKSRANAVWFSGPDFEDQLYGLTIPGNTGTNVALYTPPGVNGNTSKYGMMLGMPVIPIEQTAALGVQGDVVLADCTQYMIGERSGIKFASSMHVAFETGEQAFRWTLRNDGQPLWDKPLTQFNSANKVSPFVVLQTRA